MAPHLPTRIPSHIGPTGFANGYSSRWIVALLQPAIMLLILLGWEGLWRIDPWRENYAAMAPTYRFVGGLIVGFLALVQTLLLLNGIGWLLWNVSRLFGALLGLLLALLANVLPRVQPNWWIGIRTPWTLSSEAVWRRTHQLGGQTGVITGFAVIATSLVLPATLAIESATSLILLWAIAMTVASYRFFADPPAKPGSRLRL
ncbi:MAG: SdpI family protein [Firmicutes bacterium]|nr:SdpI family protein [Bacillota bacterium]